MKLLIIRHGDPNYDIDSLTPKGWKEVAYLSERIARLDIRDFYVSPYGRAKDTASLTPVSYTHLDVYKRQDLRSLLFS